MFYLSFLFKLFVLINLNTISSYSSYPERVFGENSHSYIHGKSSRQGERGSKDSLRGIKVRGRCFIVPSHFFYGTTFVNYSEAMIREKHSTSATTSTEGYSAAMNTKDKRHNLEGKIYPKGQDAPLLL
jgi:hypothetical protein